MADGYVEKCGEKRRMYTSQALYNKEEVDIERVFRLD